MHATDDEIQELLERYKNLESPVNERMSHIFSGKLSLIHITHRVKTAASIKEKLERKLYSSIYDIHDILGFRVICYISDDVDLAAKLISENFRVDWKRSKDKRKLIDARSFGYVALHYVCALPDDVSNLWFEIQIKTILQHSWAEIEHDLGYKTEIEVPREIRRSFSKAASLLEMADDIFSQIRAKLDEYSINVKKDIANHNFDEVFFDKITLEEFTRSNDSYRNLLNEIATISHAKILEQSPDSQLQFLLFLNIKTFGDMIKLINKQHDLTLKLARELLQDSEIDELASTAAYHFLFRAELITGDYSREKIREFFALTTKNEKLIERNTDKIMKARKSVNQQAQQRF